MNRKFRSAYALLSLFPGICCLILPATGAPRLVRDVNPQAEEIPRQVQQITMAGGKAFFSAWSSDTGSELWMSDGTAAGTRLLKDIFPGPGSSSPVRMREMGGKLYFVADDGVHGMELWCSDGTSAGTFLFADLAEGSDSSAPSLVASNESRLWFTIGTGETAGLWSSDGTAAGTIELNAMNSGVRGFTRPEHFVMKDGVLYFVAGRSELWRSDGTPEGTSRVEQARVEPGGLPVIGELAAGPGGLLYFVVRNGGAPSWLWSTTGEAGAAVRIPRSPEVSWWENLQGLVMLGDKLGFYGRAGSSDGGSNRFGDGTLAGSVSLAGHPVQPWSSQSVVVGEVMYFSGFTVEDGLELCRTDGTWEGTYVVRNIRGKHFGADVAHLQAAGRWIYFSADDGRKGPELWRSDGTSKGTRLVAETRKGRAGGRPERMTADGEAVYFLEGGPGTTGDLWRSDGTKKGTVRLTWPERLGSSAISWREPAMEVESSRMVAAGGRVYFRATDGTSGEELWGSDGTAKGTRLVQDIRIGGDASEPDQLTALGNKVVFVASGPGGLKQVWVSDGKRRGTKALTNFTADGWGAKPADFTVAGERCFFTSGQVVNNVLWVTDGTPQGTREIRDAAGQPLKVTPGTMVAQGEDVYFAVETHPAGRSVWRSDGTDAGTVRVKEVHAPSLTGGNRWILPIRRLGESVAFFSTESEETKLWVSDGTEGGTREVVVEPAWDDYFSIHESMEFGDRIVFRAHSLATGMRWWISDGTTVGTRILKDIPVNTSFDGSVRRMPRSAVMDGVLYLVVDGLSLGRELWRSDGTAEGTLPVLDIRPGEGSSDPAELTVAKGRLYFTADDGVNGRELWSSDGTPEGTVMEAESLAGPPASKPSMLTALGDRLYFATENREYGYELHVMDLPAVPAAISAVRAIADPGMESAVGAGSAEDAGDLLGLAFNLPAGSGGVRQMVPGTGTSGYPAFSKDGTTFRVEYLRRRDGSLVYTPKVSTTLEPGSYVAMDGEEIVSGIDDVWERVVIEQAIAPGTARLFGVVEVTRP
jgi:ELWxxDGT repeat protein